MAPIGPRLPRASCANSLRGRAGPTIVRDRPWNDRQHGLCRRPGGPDRKPVPRGTFGDVRAPCRSQAAAKAIRPAACQETLPDPGKAIAPLGGIRKRDPRFPRPRAPLPPRPVRSAPTTGQRPPGAGRALAGGFGPRLAWGQRSAVAGATAPARMRKARVQAEEFPAFRPSSPCGRHFFGTLSETKPVPEDHPAPRHCLLSGIRPVAISLPVCARAVCG